MKKLLSLLFVSLLGLGVVGSASYVRLRGVGATTGAGKNSPSATAPRDALDRLDETSIPNVPGDDRTKVTTSAAQPSQPVLTMTIHAIQVADDNGSRAATITPEQVRQLVDRVNQVYAPARIQFQFDPRADWSVLHNTVINSLSSFISPAWNVANQIAAQHLGKLVVFFRHGDQPNPTGNGFSFPAQSGLITNFVAMPNNSALANAGLFSHEIGHYLGLYHTFPGWNDSATDSPEKAADFIANPDCSGFPWLCATSGTANALDGDGLRDTPPEAGATFYINQGFDQCVGHDRYTISGSTIRVRGPLTNPIMEEVPFHLTFAPDRHNVMSYFPCEPKHFSPMQIEVMRRTLVNGRAPVDLTGTWTGDDGGVYYLRQLGDTVWWAGLSAESPGGTDDFHKGLGFSNVFRGRKSGDTITGEWADVPRGQILNNGALTLDLVLATSGVEIRKRSQTGGFGGSVWRRSRQGAEPCNLPCRFQAVRRNDGDPIGGEEGHLDVFDYNYVVFGSIQSPVLAVNFPPDVARTYTNFTCPKPENHQQAWYRGDGDPPDGDLHFDIRAEREREDYHVELIMFGRPAGNRFCGRFDTVPNPSLLPGWAETGTNSILLNGRPINANVTIATPAGAQDPCNRMLRDANAGSCAATAILGTTLPAQTRVRITGAKARDEHGTLEIHPVYSIDILQNFHLPGSATELTGVWSANDGGTYYLRQVGNTVWWLGLSRDRGATFANVFQGTLREGTISGEWADIPLGSIQGAGVLTLTGLTGQTSTTLSKRSFTGGFGAQEWEKLYDVRPNFRPVVADPRPIQ